jgi:hypothetical protein
MSLVLIRLEKKPLGERFLEGTANHFELPMINRTSLALRELSAYQRYELGWYHVKASLRWAFFI